MSQVPFLGFGFFTGFGSGVYVFFTVGSYSLQAGSRAVRASGWEDGAVTRATHHAAAPDGRP